MAGNYTFSVMNRIPDSELVRIGYRPVDFLESNHIRGPFQKTFATLIPLLLTRVYYKEYLLRYGPYPVLRVSSQFGKWSMRQKVHWLLPILSVGVSLWWGELAYNRAVLGLQGSEPIPDQVFKRLVIYQ